jgi:acetyltransferase-like isoleucine patch superfamily enzyme
MIEQLASRAEADLEDPSADAGPRLLVVRLLQYLTNYVVSHVPSFTLRRLWYQHILGIRLDSHAGIHLGCHVWFYGPGQLRRSGVRIGAYSRVNRNCCLDARGGLAIGQHVSISPDVTILTASHAVNDPAFRVEVRSVAIEDHVWIGTRALILPGVTLGRGCVVAAGSTVSRDVPPLTVVAGVPAVPVADRDPAAAEYVLDTPFPLFE